MEVLVLDHVAIKTAKLKESRAFYVDVLGLSVGPRPDFPFEGFWLYAGGRDVVHLMASDSPPCPSTIAAINHFALRVADFDAAVRELKARGVAVLVDDAPGCELRQAYLMDPNGVRIELNAPTRRS